MRTDRHLAALSLALALGACSTRQDQTATLPDDLKKDLAVASSPASDLATAPRNYQRMRFVSGIEQWRGGAPAKRPKTTRHLTRSARVQEPVSAAAAADIAPDPVASMVAESPAPVSTPEAVSEPAVVVTRGPIAEPSNAPAPSSEGAGDGGRIQRRGGGGGLGGLLGGIIGAVVIRGGHSGLDPCDPKTDGRARPTMTERPDFGMPLPTGQIFGGSHRH